MWAPTSSLAELGSAKRRRCFDFIFNVSTDPVINIHIWVKLYTFGRKYTHSGVNRSEMCSLEAKITEIMEKFQQPNHFLGPNLSKSEVLLSILKLSHIIDTCSISLVSFSCKFLMPSSHLNSFTSTSLFKGTQHAA